MAKKFIDSDNGNDANSGDTTGAAYKTLGKYTTEARSAGDIAVLRGGMTAGYHVDATQLTFLSDGDKGNPIIVERDWDDDYSDHANSAQTYTLVFGSKTHTASATITGLSANEWIFNTTDGDNPREYSYEVASVSGTTLTLFLPYKGTTGATKTLKVMPAAPFWGGTASSSDEWFINGDNYWKFQGIEARGTAGFGLWRFDDNARGIEFWDMINLGSGTTAIGYFPFDNIELYFNKCRFDGMRRGLTQGGHITAEHKDCLWDLNAGSSTWIMDLGSERGELVFIDNEFKDIANVINNSNANAHGVSPSFQNCKITSMTQNFINETVAGLHTWGPMGIEDYDNEPGDWRSYSHNSDAEDNILMQSDKVTVRAGGATIAVEVNPSADLSNLSPFTIDKLIDRYGIQLPASATTITIFFASDATGDWTTNPTAAEMWLELEYWDHATNDFRKLVKSTGTVDFKTDTDFDQSLAITVTPGQAGRAYLSLKYAKPTEATKTNKFRFDPIPVIT